MKKGLLIFIAFFIALCSFSQDKDGVIKVRKRQSNTPKIAGIPGGEIDAALLCTGDGIVVNKNLKVVSFVFIAEKGDQDITIKHNGNTLNQNACDIIALLKSGAGVYINEITVVDDRGRQSITTPMRFTIK